MSFARATGSENDLDICHHLIRVACVCSTWRLTGSRRVGSITHRHRRSWVFFIRRILFSRSERTIFDRSCWDILSFCLFQSIPWQQPCLAQFLRSTKSTITTNDLWLNGQRKSSRRPVESDAYFGDERNRKRTKAQVFGPTNFASANWHRSFRDRNI